MEAGLIYFKHHISNQRLLLSARLWAVCFMQELVFCFVFVFCLLLHSALDLFCVRGVYMLFYYQNKKRLPNALKENISQTD